MKLVFPDKLEINKTYLNELQSLVDLITYEDIPNN